ncbi:Probable phospholipid-transporting ATPase 8 [Linum grandiflorum]
MTSLSQDYGLIIDIWGRGVKKWKLIATYVELLEDYSLLVVIGANNRLCKVLGNNSTFTQTTGKHFRVGDILEVDKDEHFPTDLLLPSLSYNDGAYYLKTKNLDGETNLNRKYGFNLNLSVKNKSLSRASSAEGNPTELDADFKFVPLNVDASVFGPPVRLLLGFEDEKVAKIHKVLHEMNDELLQPVVCMEAINAAQPNLKALKVAKLSSNIQILKNDHAILTDEVKKIYIRMPASEIERNNKLKTRVGAIVEADDGNNRLNQWSILD